ncbi:hypothetical protein [Scytonema sp. NUACC26]|uniref:hypothetical protein n=1 Tax=Scytonema sp. NUACC26 TaxID=3140176 RepID=UPI0034DBE038
MRQADPLTNQPSLFSPKNRVELDQLIAPLPDDSEQLSIAVSDWYQKHPQILEAQLELLSESSDSILSQKRTPGTQQGSVKPPDKKASKQNLQNSIQQSSSSSSSQSSSSN